MNILLSIVAFIAVFVSIVLITVGTREKVSSCSSMGGIILLITVATAVSYYFDWFIPLIIIFGTAGMMFTFMGTSGEDSKDSTRIGFIETVIGVVLLAIALYYWYRMEWYASLGFTTCLISFLFLFSGLKNDSDYKPILSLSVSILFALATIYLWMFLRLNEFIVFIGGFIGALILRVMWKVFYEKDYWIKKKESCLSWLHF